MVAENEVRLENIDAIDENAENVPSNEHEVATRSQVNSQVEASSKYKRDKKKSQLDDEIVILKEGFDNVAKAIASSTSELVKATTLLISENEVWNLLDDLDIDEQKCLACYFYLIKNPKMLRALLGCPLECCKDLLL